MTKSTVAESIRRNIADFSRVAAEGGRAAAVVICVIDDPAEPHLLMIRRAFRGMNGGQWALPGGKIDPGETAEAAGRREVSEEIGLELGESEIVGALDDFVTDSGFVMTPFIAVTPAPVQPRRNPAEVDSIHRIPLARLVQDDLPRWTPAPSGPPLLQMPLRRNMIVHAPTGAILYQFREVALLGRDTRVADLRQPEFTRE
ncbi:CoA pyrophosphatase [Nocardia sp. NEAU-G5]|uniref:CoA pyrophosphatase n=1 Tax=Nocardia albiluteola TaxID=2842303 RepID=A0ABS6B9J6_9NOCA|nr:CoA pyrophosphatase [Nocardia albiluteola]MBU3066954.1 CoA pyrophosphatase [Nocardia albiluteola]